MPMSSVIDMYISDDLYDFLREFRNVNRRFVEDAVSMADPDANPRLYERGRSMLREVRDALDELAEWFENEAEEARYDDYEGEYDEGALESLEYEAREAKDELDYYFRKTR